MHFRKKYCLLYFSLWWRYCFFQSVNYIFEWQNAFLYHFNILFQTWPSSNLRVYSWGNRKHYYKGIYFNVKILLWQFAIIFFLGLGEGFCHIFTNLTFLRPSEFTFIVNVFLFSSFWRIPKSSNFSCLPDVISHKQFKNYPPLNPSQWMFLIPINRFYSTGFNCRLGIVTPRCVRPSCRSSTSCWLHGIRKLFKASQDCKAFGRRIKHTE